MPHRPDRTPATAVADRASTLLWQDFLDGEVGGAADPGDPFDLTNPAVAWSTFTMPGNALHFSGDIVATTSLDLDIYIGQDLNGNGKPERAETLCTGATAAALDGCTIEDAAPGAYWVLLHNYTGSGAVTDSYTVVLAASGPIVQITSSAPVSAGEVLHPGDTVVFTIGIQLPLPAFEQVEYTLSNVLPTGLRYVTGSASPAPLAVVGQQLTWVTRTSGAFVTITYTARVADDAPQDTLLTNTLSFNFRPGGGPLPETVSTDVVVTSVELAITAHAPAQASLGSVIPYSLTVANNGVGNARDVVVIAVLPPGAEHVSGGALYGELVVWEVAEVPAQGSVEVGFTAQRRAPLLTIPPAPDQGVARIVGGEPAQPGEIPWQVALWDMEFDVWWGCGASLIAPEWVLTAAHCVTEFLDGELSADIVGAAVGRHHIEGDEGETIAASEVIVNPGFSSISSSNDVALLRLERPVSFSAAVEPIVMANGADSVLYTPGTPALVSGWGTRQYGVPDYPDELYKVTVPVVDRATCDEAYQVNGGYPPDTIDATMICAGLPEGGKDSCQGDSGGPMAVQNADGGWVQIGIVSWGEGCAEPGLPGVYSDVAALMPWIQRAQNTLTLRDYAALDATRLPGHSAVGEEPVSTLVMDFGFLPLVTQE